MTMSNKTDELLNKAKALKLYGLVEHWDEIDSFDWVESLIAWEESERSDRGLERRLKNSRLGRFKKLSEFDWSWPKKCDREAVEEWMKLSFIKEATNIIV